MQRKNVYRVLVDILYTLDRELDFVGRFYTRTTEPFETIKRKIDAQELPFFPAEVSNDDGEPKYLDEWLEADEILSVLGLGALSLIEKSLHDYLRTFAMWELNSLRDEDFASHFKKLKGKGWLNKYLGFLEDRGFFWSTSPVPRDRLEQLNFTRNDVAHSHTITGPCKPMRGKRHIEKFPVSMFANETELAMLEGSDEPAIYVKVSREKVGEAIDVVRSFCAHVDTKRTV